MRHLVIGTGEVGCALMNVLCCTAGTKRECYSIDRGQNAPGKFNVVHICYPWHSKFRGTTRDYMKRYLRKDGIMIVHSSVPVGVCDQLGVVHSPIRGVHPNLVQGIRTFTKFFGGERAYNAAWHFADIGIDVYIVPRAADTEAMKLWDTTYYGLCIAFEKEVRRFCDERGLDFETVYRQANLTYNDGYAKLGMPHVVRPVLAHKPGKIGGHCVIPNAELLIGEPIPDFIRKQNERY